MRDINVVKYRKLLYNLQFFCSCSKKELYKLLDKKVLQITLSGQKKYKTKKLTDFERGYIDGKHSAYNEVLRELQKMVEYADFDWEHIHCREENNT